MSDVIKTPIKEPVILDRTGREIVKNLKSIAEKLWGEKVLEVPSKAVNFYDYDGTRVYSYTKAEFLGLEALPANPAHEGLTAQGWNYSLATAKEYVSKYGYLDIGQTYTTDDGKTRLYVEMDYTQNCTANIKINQSVADGVTVDWGDGSDAETVSTAGDVAFSHTYAAEGHYVITLTPAEGATFKLGQGTGSGTTLNNVGGIQKLFFYQGLTGRIVGKDALVAVEIGDGVTDIGGGAFAYMTRMQYITIPNNVTMVRDIAFYASEEAEKRILRLTKKELLEAVGACLRVFSSYMALRYRYDCLKASLDILREQNMEMIKLFKAIETQYDKAESESQHFEHDYHKSVYELDRMLDQVPQEFWIQ